MKLYLSTDNTKPYDNIFTFPSSHFYATVVILYISICNFKFAYILHFISICKVDL